MKKGRATFDTTSDELLPVAIYLMSTTEAIKQNVTLPFFVAATSSHWK
jgi:hypothetical protein